VFRSEWALTLILAVLGPAIAAWPLSLQTLLLSAMMVTAMTWFVIPTLTRLFRGWLASGSPRSPSPPPVAAVLPASSSAVSAQRRNGGFRLRDV
jgi:hypothetical protein